MHRLCCGCLSRRKRKSFPIHEIQRDAKINKVFIRHVENIRLVTPPPIINSQQDKKTISKATIKKDSRTPVLKATENSKQLNISPSSPNDIPEGNYDKTGSSWSSSTNTNFDKDKKSSKHRSYVESYDLSKENTTASKNITQSKNITNDIKPSAKSKAVLENVRKMIKDQNIQQQHLNHTQQKESVRL